MLDKIRDKLSNFFLFPGWGGWRGRGDRRRRRRKIEKLKRKIDKFVFFPDLWGNCVENPSNRQRTFRIYCSIPSECRKNANPNIPTFLFKVFCETKLLRRKKMSFQFRHFRLLYTNQNVRPLFSNWISWSITSFIAINVKLNSAYNESKIWSDWMV